MTTLLIEVLRLVGAVAVSGVVASFVTFQLTKRDKRQELLRERAEAIFNDFRSYIGYFQAMHLSMMQLLEAKGKDQVLQWLADYTKKNPPAKDLTTKLEFNTKIFFPSLTPELDELHKIVEDVFKMMTDLVQSKSDDAIQKFVGIFQRFNSLRPRFEQKLIEEARKSLLDESFFDLLKFGQSTK
jgi:hypothetical protein